MAASRSQRSAEENPLESIGMACAFWTGDWAQDARLAWIYGIACGWDDAIAEVAAKHRWTPETVMRLRRLRERYKKLEKAEAGRKG